MRPCYAEINIENLKNNLLIVKSKSNGKKIMAVVKANAYGHGSIEVSKTLIENGVDYLAVATLEEALLLRKEFKYIPILILGPIYDDEIDNAIQNNISITVSNKEHANKINHQASLLKEKAIVHIAIDTGMRRIGVQTDFGIDKCIDEINSILNMDELNIEGIFTHFASSDSKDISFMNTQFNLFKDIINKINYKFKYIHCSNSSAIEFFNDSLFNMVRPGLILYGYSSRNESNIKDNLKPILNWKCKISNLKTVEAFKSIGYSQNYVTSRNSRIATIPVGYADGYNRLLSNKGIVFVNKMPCRIVGNICMDQCMIDVTNLKECNIGDIVELLNEDFNAENIANMCDTIPYEILCNISSRVPRVYKTEVEQ